jgi:hypothetical protein
MKLIDGPAALSWRFGPGHHALIAPQCRCLRENNLCEKDIYLPAPCAWPHASYLHAVPEEIFLGLSSKDHPMTNENQKPVAPGTSKVEPANTPYSPQQNQGDSKPGTDKQQQQK